MKIVCAGEILWDVFPDAEHLGGAVFNFAAHARRLGHEVLFVSGVGDDERGRRALKRAAELGLPASLIRVVPGTETGKVTVAVDPAGQPNFTIHRPAAYDFAEVEDFRGLLDPQPCWIAFGTLFQMSERGRALIRGILSAARGSPVFYDINLRADSYTESIVLESLEASTIVKLSDAEVAPVAAITGGRGGSVEEFARGLAARFQLRAVAVTLGALGCSLLLDGEYVESRGYPVRVVDTVGAGDAFSAALVHGIGSGWPASEIAGFANRVGALVASRAGGTPEWSVEEALSLRRP